MFIEEVIARVPAARVGTPSDVAEVLFLASPAASFAVPVMLPKRVEDVHGRHPTAR